MALVKDPQDRFCGALVSGVNSLRGKIKMGILNVVFFACSFGIIFLASPFVLAHSFGSAVGTIWFMWCSLGSAVLYVTKHYPASLSKEFFLKYSFTGAGLLLGFGLAVWPLLYIWLPDQD